MQTFLPSGYSFSLDKLANPQAYRLVVENYKKFFIHQNHIFRFGIFLIIFAILCTILERSIRGKGDPLIKSVWPLILILPVVCMGFIVTFTDKPPIKPQDYYKTALFNLPIKSNLTAHMLDSDHRPKNMKDHKEYPYKIYLNNPKKYKFALEGDNWRTTGNYQLYTKKKICIGQVQNGKFKPAGNNLAATFYRYHVYIMKHHLSHKFVKTMTLKPNGQYITSNNNVQWVLSNEKDLILYLHNGSDVRESKIKD